MDGDRHENVVSSDAQLRGTVFQARDIQGSIHLHTVHEGPDRATPAPRQLPPVSGFFTGRDEALAALDELLVDSHGSEAHNPLIVVSGPAGVGKTTLVSKWLHALVPRFPDGQLYADLRGHSASSPATPSEILSKFLRALGTTAIPVDASELALLWRTCTAERRLAVMCDNAFTASQVRSLLPGGQNNLVVATSRRRLSGLRMDGAEFHQLEALDPASGVALLTRGIGVDRVAREPSDARRIVDLCAGLPLAVCLASARLAARPKQTVKALADALNRDEGSLDVLALEGEATLLKALDASYTVLSPEAASLYRRLGTLPVLTFDTDICAAACAQTQEWAARYLDELVEANLVVDIGPESYRFHDLVRVHARNTARDSDDVMGRQESERRVCDWYLRTVTAAQAWLTPAQFTLSRTYVYPTDLPLPFTDHTSALGWLDLQRTNLMAVTRSAAAAAWHTMAWELVDAMWPLFLRLRHYDLWIEAHNIGLEAARKDENAEAVRQMLNSGAIGLTAAGRIEDAVSWYEMSLRAAREAGDVRDEGQALLGLGSCHREAGRMTDAVPYLHQAISRWENCGYPRGVALAEIVLGDIALSEGNQRRAIECFTRSRDTLLEVNDPHDAARALTFLGRARASAGEYARGVGLMEEALGIFASSGAAHWQARTLEMLSDSALERGDQPGAWDLRQRACMLYSTTSPRDARRLGGRPEDDNQIAD